MTSKSVKVSFDSNVRRILYAFTLRFTENQRERRYTLAMVHRAPVAQINILHRLQGTAAVLVAVDIPFVVRVEYLFPPLR